jgi:hypothetical protein
MGLVLVEGDIGLELRVIEGGICLRQREREILKTFHGLNQERKRLLLEETRSRHRRKRRRQQCRGAQSQVAQRSREFQRPCVIDGQEREGW